MKKGKIPKIAREKTCAKPQCQKASTLCSKEDDLNKLEKFCRIENFVKKNTDRWDHQTWLEFCAEIAEGGFEPIDFDHIGLILENHKTAFLSQI
jgi:hypothetical protein